MDMMKFETIHIGHTIVQRWEDGLTKHFSYLNWKGELIIQRGDQWWDLFDILKTGNLEIAEEHTSSCSRYHQVKVITFKESVCGKQIGLYGPAWSGFLKAVRVAPSVTHKLDFVELESIADIEIREVG